MESFLTQYVLCLGVAHTAEAAWPVLAVSLFHPNTSGVSYPLTILGMADHQYGNRPFGIKHHDRFLHMALFGQTGTGKSTLMEHLARQDAHAGIGLCFIDPHGDSAKRLHDRLTIPHHYWSVADPASPYGYNPLAPVARQYRPLLASGLIDTFKQQWRDAWGVRMEHLLRYAILALLDYGEADLRDIIRLYVDKEFRRTVIRTLHDAQVIQFWTKEYPAMNYANTSDGVASIANKLGAFLASPVVRTALCDPSQPLRFRRLMDQGEILIVNLAKGQLGSDISTVVGGLLVSSLMHAAYTRHSLPPQARRPFMLYVDEFPSFTTTAFANLMAEARKYGVGVILAAQHLSQIERPVFDAIMGNVGSLLSFRVGALDAPLIAKQLGDLAPQQLHTLPNHRAYTSLMIDGQPSPVFSAHTLPPQQV
jgi:hypothetical protein